MPGDVQILAPGTSAAPLQYVIPGSVEITLKSLRAVFDGSGSASAFRPAVQIIGPGGDVVGNYVTQEDVAAGASADVSFFPGAKQAAASAGAATVIESATVVGGSDQGGANQTINAGTSAVVTFSTTLFQTGDGSAFGFEHPFGDYRFILNNPGLYMAVFQTEFTADPVLSAVSLRLQFTNAAFGLTPWQTLDTANPPIGNLGTTMVGFDGTSATKVEVVQAVSFAYLDTVPGHLLTVVYNNSASNFTLASRTMHVMLLRTMTAADFAGFPFAFP